MVVIISVLILYALIALIGWKYDINYKSSHDKSNPNDIYFNPIVNELKNNNEFNNRKWNDKS